MPNYLPFTTDNMPSWYNTYPNWDALTLFDFDDSGASSDKYAENIIAFDAEVLIAYSLANRYRTGDEPLENVYKEHLLDGIEPGSPEWYIFNSIFPGADPMFADQEEELLAKFKKASVHWHIIWAYFNHDGVPTANFDFIKSYVQKAASAWDSRWTDDATAAGARFRALIAAEAAEAAAEAAEEAAEAEAVIQARIDAAVAAALAEAAQEDETPAETPDDDGATQDDGSTDGG